MFTIKKETPQYNDKEKNYYPFRPAYYTCCKRKDIQLSGWKTGSHGLVIF